MLLFTVVYTPAWSHWTNIIFFLSVFIFLLLQCWLWRFLDSYTLKHANTFPLGNVRGTIVRICRYLELLKSTLALSYFINDFYHESTVIVFLDKLTFLISLIHFSLFINCPRCIYFWYCKCYYFLFYSS